MVSGIQPCRNNFFINPFCQGFCNIRDGVLGKKTEAVAQNALGQAEPSKLSLGNRISKIAIGIILVIPIVNMIVAAILRNINSQFIYTENTPQLEPTPPQPTPPQPIRLQPIPPQPTPEMIARKTTALARLEHIERLIPEGSNPQQAFDALTPHFICNPQLLALDLDAILQGYQTNERGSKLLEFMDWAGIQEAPRREAFTRAIHTYTQHEIPFIAYLSVAVENVLKNLVAYFDQKRLVVGVGTPQEEALKEQFRHVCDTIIDANNDCVFQMLSQVQTLALTVLAEDAASQRNSPQARIFAHAAVALCTYRTNLLRDILIRQNFGEEHMANLERAATQRAAERLGLRGTVFRVADIAHYGLDNVDYRIERAITTLLAEYKPAQYLLEQLRTNVGDIRTLRNEIPEWANEYYDLRNEEARNAERQPHEMDRRLSEVNFAELQEEDLENPAIMSAGEGGNFTPAATALLLEALGLITAV